jgi:hypothetical protein
LAIVDLPSKMPPDVPGASRLWAHEQTTSGPGGDGLVRYLAGVAGQNVFILCTSGEQDAWNWSALGGLAQAQAAQISRTPEDDDA